jgi:hypothetical protein
MKTSVLLSMSVQLTPLCGIRHGNRESLNTSRGFGRDA